MLNTKLLIVDDEERFLDTTKSLLDKRGFNTMIASRGIDALKILESHDIDVIVLDIKMPGIDGLETLRKIKQKHSLIEVIILTGHGTAESAVEGLKLGAFDYLMKPCSIPEMMEKIKSAHTKKQTMEEKIRSVKLNKIISHPLEVFED